MATVVIQKRKRQNYTSYMVHYWDPVTGKKVYYKSYRKFREAQQKANELREALDAGKNPKKTKIKLRPLTFSEAGKDLRREWEARHSKKELSEKTITEYKYWLNTLEKRFGSKILCQFQEKEIAAFRDETAINLSNVSANKYLSIIKKVFQHGIKLHAVIENVSEKVQYLSEKHHVRNSFILPAQIDTLIEKSRFTRAKHYMPAIIFLGVEHAGSKQEILSLRWSDIDFEFQEIGLISFFRTKNKKKRTDFLMPRTKQALLEWKEHLEWMRHRKGIEPEETDRVFCHLNGTRIKDFTRAWHKTRHLSGMDDLHFHDLRHTFASNLILAGGGIKDAKDMIGHSDISMTDRYTHLTANRHLAMQQKLASHYEGQSKETL